MNCPYCGEEMISDSYPWRHTDGILKGKRSKTTNLLFCDNPNCMVQPCTNDHYKTRELLEEIKSMNGDFKELNQEIFKEIFGAVLP